MSNITGIHHVTAISGPAQENLDFYAGILGMRLVKRSVNQDDPATYHLFYADAEGHPGSDLTFFPWADMPRGRDGTGLTNEVSLAVPEGSLGYWEERLARRIAMLLGRSRRPAEQCRVRSDVGRPASSPKRCARGTRPYWPLERMLGKEKAAEFLVRYERQTAREGTAGLKGSMPKIEYLTSPKSGDFGHGWNTDFHGSRQ